MRHDFHRLPIADQDMWLTELAATLNWQLEWVVSMAAIAFDRIDLRVRELDDLLQRLAAFDKTPEEKGVLMWKWVKANGGACYLDDRQQVLLAAAGNVVAVGNNLHFDAFLLREAE